MTAKISDDNVRFEVPTVPTADENAENWTSGPPPARRPEGRGVMGTGRPPGEQLGDSRSRGSSGVLTSEHRRCREVGRGLGPLPVNNEGK